LLPALGGGTARRRPNPVRWPVTGRVAAAPDRPPRSGPGLPDPRLFSSMDGLENMLVAEKDHPGEGLAAALAPGPFVEAGRQAARRAAWWLTAFGLAGQAPLLASELSGGQMKLLETARALMGQPRLLLLDEPAAGVAPALAQGIFQKLRRLREEQGITLLT